jgi:hypothetical protein
MSHVKQTDAAKTQILKISFSWIHFLIFLKSQNKKNQATGGAGALARHVARRVIVYGHIRLLFAASPAWARDAFFTRRFGLHKKQVFFFF